MNKKIIELAEIIKISKEAEQRKIAILAQAIHETGLGTSELFQKHNNAFGLKWRGELGLENVYSHDYKASDGYDNYMGANTLLDGFSYYLKFIERDVYKGWGSALASGGALGYIKHLKTKGYATDPDYVEKVENYFNEAKNLLGLINPTNPTSKYKFGVIIGHDYKSAGAVSYNGISEWQYNLGVAKKLQEKVKNLYIFTKLGLNYTEINEAYKDLGINFSLELHFNSFSQVARGMEMLILKTASIEDLILADKMTDDLATLLGIPQRHSSTLNNKRINGLKILNPSDRGAVCLKSINCPTKMLFEPCFGNTKNPDSVKLFEAGGDEFYATALAAVLNKLNETEPTEPNINYQEKYEELASIILNIKELIKNV